MAYNPIVSFRTTQRAPRSCISCSSRKVKCDKSVPCGTCIRRGQSDACIREMVIVRGEVTTYRDGPHVPTYEELRSENEQLRNEIESMKTQQGKNEQKSALGLSPGPTMDSGRILSPKQCFDQDGDGLEQSLWDRLASDSSAMKSLVSTWDDIVIPSRACSEHLLAYDEQWNSWVHYALEYPRFRTECDTFMASIENGLCIERADPFWMAVYFSVLSVSLPDFTTTE